MTRYFYPPYSHMLGIQFNTWSNVTLFLLVHRNNARTITSLPVSPSSSPLRHYGPAYKSCFISPPHPSFAMMGQGSYNLNDFPLRPNTKNILDPWFEIPQYNNSQTPPNRSPRRGPILWLQRSIKETFPSLITWVLYAFDIPFCFLSEFGWFWCWRSESGSSSRKGRIKFCHGK